MKKIIHITALSVLMICASQAQPTQNPIMGVWETERQGDESRIAHVKIEACKANANELCGHIVWSERKIDEETGKPPLDKLNPDEKLRTRPIMGMEMLWGFKPANDTFTKYEDGNVYSASSGKTYNGSMELKDADTLYLTGHVFIFSKTQTWKRVKDNAERKKSK